ncbi:MAG: Hsp70 family protein [Actinomycetota bacterium]
MHLGVDFGTTRTIVAWVDRGNYPVVSFLDPDGDAHEYYPSVVALRGDDLVFGFEALAASADGSPLLKSFKRVLATADVTPVTPLVVGGREFPVLDVLTGFMAALLRALATSSSVSAGFEAGPTMVAVPAHAHGPQRFLTLEAFRRSGFPVAGMVNEPSAAGFEYSHRQGRTLNSRRTRVIVYDLGGGTFDASLVNVDGTSHDVLDSIGANNLGGDDFDEVLAECALAEAGTTREEIGARAFATLLEECREAKEHLAPQTRRIALEVAGTPATVLVADFYADAAPLVETSIDVMVPLVAGLGEGEFGDVAGIYLVGGASGLPLVPRALRERFGRRVHRSPYPAASTAIGLAIAADDAAAFSLTDRLSRGFGVFRERAGGTTVSFDALLGREEKVSARTDVVVTRRYRAAHNVGWFRFVEYSAVDDAGEPHGDIVPFAEVVFPFDPALQDGRDLHDVPVERREDGPLVEETYTIDPHGIVSVRITDLATGYTRTEALRAGDEA